jgi:hypothetical protein
MFYCSIIPLYRDKLLAHVGIKKTPTKKVEVYAGRPGLEPGLFWTKTRRVAYYTIGQSGCKFIGYKPLPQNSRLNFFVPLTLGNIFLKTPINIRGNSCRMKIQEFEVFMKQKQIIFFLMFL